MSELVTPEVLGSVSPVGAPVTADAIRDLAGQAVVSMVGEVLNAAATGRLQVNNTGDSKRLMATAKDLLAVVAGAELLELRRDMPTDPAELRGVLVELREVVERRKKAS